VQGEREIPLNFIFYLSTMLAENKRRIEETLSMISDEYVEDILKYLESLNAKQKTPDRELSSMLLSEPSLAKEWLSKEEEDTWAHL
jgi:hypothetical protein